MPRAVTSSQLPTPRSAHEGPSIETVPRSVIRTVMSSHHSSKRSAGRISLPFGSGDPRGARRAPLSRTSLARGWHTACHVSSTWRGMGSHCPGHHWTEARVTLIGRAGGEHAASHRQDVRSARTRGNRITANARGNADAPSYDSPQRPNGKPAHRPPAVAIPFPAGRLERTHSREPDHRERTRQCRRPFVR